MADLIDFKTGKPIGGGPGNTPPTPPNFPNPALPQVPYRIICVDKITGGEVVYEKKGHIVVTASNIVLFDERQDMLWGIPNDASVISFERMEDEEYMGDSMWPDDDAETEEPL